MLYICQLLNSKGVGPSYTEHFGYIELSGDHLAYIPNFRH